MLPVGEGLVFGKQRVKSARDFRQQNGGYQQEQQSRYDGQNEANNPQGQADYDGYTAGYLPHKRGTVGVVVRIIH